MKDIKSMKTLLSHNAVPDVFDISETLESPIGNDDVKKKTKTFLYDACMFPLQKLVYSNLLPLVYYNVK